MLAFQFVQLWYLRQPLLVLISASAQPYLGLSIALSQALPPLFQSLLTIVPTSHPYLSLFSHLSQPLISTTLILPASLHPHIPAFLLIAWTSSHPLLSCVSTSTQPISASSHLSQTLLNLFVSLSSTLPQPLLIYSQPLLSIISASYPYFSLSLSQPLFISASLLNLVWNTLQHFCQPLFNFNSVFSQSILRLF